MIEWVLLGAAIITALWVVMTYNGFVSLRMRGKNAMAQINVQLKKRNDLVPNLVSTVKGYAKHEKKVFTEVTKARTSMMKASGLNQKAKASNQLTNTLKSLFAVAENYPKLQANENFLQLQNELSSIEEKIAYARSFYNDVVQMYNTKLEVIPDSIIGNRFGFKKLSFFETAAGEKKTPKVEF